MADTTPVTIKSRGATCRQVVVWHLDVKHNTIFSYNYIPEIWNFGDILVLVWTPPPSTPPHPPHLPPHPPPHTKACVSRNCGINAYQIHIWHSHWWPRVEEPYRFWRLPGKTKWPPAAILWKYDEKHCALHNLIQNAPINFIFDVATELL